ncbi:MAG: glycosyltransferase family 2 protein, partial [Patescibacteria group bacterium]|nr:glycosyltransferase family 2 protein [Patescibacteria group bacterium]
MYDLDIVIINFKTPDKTIRAIDSLLKYTRNSRIILVDNNSQDHSVTEFKKRYAYSRNVILIENNINAGYGKACNLGAKSVSDPAPYIAIANSDIWVKQDWFYNLKKPFENPNVFAVGPKLLNQANRIVGCGVFVQNNRLTIRGWMYPPQHFSNEEEVDSLCGAFFIADRKKFDELEGFDPQFHFYFEESDLFLRAKEKGYKNIYNPKSIV